MVPASLLGELKIGLEYACTCSGSTSMAPPQLGAFAHTALRSYAPKESRPGLQFHSEDELSGPRAKPERRFFTRSAHAGWDTWTTLDVVAGHVKGGGRLREADASVMNTITSGCMNSQASCCGCRGLKRVKVGTEDGALERVKPAVILMDSGSEGGNVSAGQYAIASG